MAPCKNPRRTLALRTRACVGLLALSTTAHAYRTAEDRSQFAGAGPVGWNDRAIEFVVSDVAPTSLSVDDVVQAVDSAANTWGVADCAAPAFQVSGLASLPAASGDGRNSVEWVFTGWEKRGFPASAPGATDVVYEKKSGAWHIIEADIYLNAELFQWSKLPAAPVYLNAVIVHELGHALGLLHPCETMATADPSAPTCSSVNGASETAMYPEYDPAQASLSQDDVAGLCFLYPKQSCEQSGCPAGSACIDGACQPGCSVETPCNSGAAPLGDPCMQGSECSTGVCVDGHCVQACGVTPGCGASECATSADGARYCKTTLGALGDTCGAPAECLGQHCVQVGESAPVCTRACGAGCPGGWTCMSVEDTGVCLLQKQVEASGGGCALAQRTPRAPTLPVFMFVLSLLVTSWQRRVRRRRATRQKEEERCEPGS